jgi:hypothetical protein
MFKRLWKSGWLAGALIVLLTVVAYLPAMRGGFIWDDDAYVTENQTLRSAKGLRQIWLNPKETVQYYPLTFTVFWVECRLWGLHPSTQFCSGGFCRGCACRARGGRLPCLHYIRSM